MTLVVALLIAMGTYGCGDTSAGPTSPASTVARPSGDPLGRADRDRLALALFRNYQGVGATFVADVDYAEDYAVSLRGSVDWRDHTGQVTVRTEGSPSTEGAPSTEVLAFTEDTVFEPATDAQVQEAVSLGRPKVSWVARPPDLSRPIDQLITLLVSLASTRPENPELLSQQDLVFDRRATVGETAVIVYRSARAQYWVAEQSGLLVRLVGNLEGFRGEVAFSFADHGPVDIELPEDTDVIGREVLSTGP